MKNAEPGGISRLESEGGLKMKATKNGRAYFTVLCINDWIRDSGYAGQYETEEEAQAMADSLTAGAEKMPINVWRYKVAKVYEDSEGRVFPIEF